MESREIEVRRRAILYPSEYFDDRRQQFINLIINESLPDGVLFPEILAQYSPEELRNLPYTYENVRIFINTLAFLTINFRQIPNDFREFLDGLQGNMVTLKILQEYRTRLNNNELFNVFIGKAFLFKQEWIQRIAEAEAEEEEEAEYDSDEYDSDEYNSDEDESSDYIIPETLTPREIQQHSQPLTIRDEDTGFDAIEGDKSVKTHIAENPEHLVFVITTKSGQNSYFLTSKEQLKDVIKNKSNIQYICKKYGKHILQVHRKDIHFERPLFRIASIGVTIPYVYLDQIKYLLESPKQVYIISESPVEQAVAVASHDVLDGGHVVSGSHCQHVEGNLPYPIYSLTYTDIVNTNDVDSDTDTLVDSDTDTLVDSDTDTLVDTDVDDEPPAKKIRNGGQIRKRKTRKGKNEIRKRKSEIRKKKSQIRKRKTRKGNKKRKSEIRKGKGRNKTRRSSNRVKSK